jgi:hypothetical protein
MCPAMQKAEMEHIVRTITGLLRAPTDPRHPLLRFPWNPHCPVPRHL